ncbi:MAG: DUF4962 domain-containing protein [Comamonadaceae bacterium]|jgi:hypothetical protein|nr:DUF4962 domain-containing protein [Comamonadaceae bacterium]
MSVVRPITLSCAALAVALLLAACQQPRRQATPDIDAQLRLEPPSAGPASCAALASDWLQRMPAYQRLIAPADCSTVPVTPLLSWGEARDRLAGTSYSVSVRRAGGGMVLGRGGVAEPRLRITQPLAAGDYEWMVSYLNTGGATVASSWRRFTIEAAAAARPLATAETTALKLSELPDGANLAAQVAGRAHPRLLAANSSFAAVRAASQTAENLPVLKVLRNRAAWYVTQALPAPPDAAGTVVGSANLAQVQATQNLVQTARGERFNIEYLAIIGRLDNNAAMLAQARARTLSLAAWSPTGLSSEAKSDQSNREIYLALAEGLDLFWNDFTPAERSRIIGSLRARVLQASASLTLLDREPYDSHSQTNLRFITQALMLAVGAPEFPEAQALLARYWELGFFFNDVWGADGSFGNGIAYGWYNLTGTVPYAAAVRIISGVDLYKLPAYARAGEQLIAFTPPGWQQPSAYGDEMETKNLYDGYSAAFYRMHAQMTRDPSDVWYWQAKAANVTAPNDANILQLLLLGVDSSPLPRGVAPASHDWFSTDAGLAAMHLDIRRGDRTSVFFRSSRFGAFNHSHADQNSLVYVSQGQPLLINAGYYPYYNSPHHKSIRSTRYQNALTFDGGFGQSEDLSIANGRPTNAFHSMDTTGALIRATSQGLLSAVTGDATPAYRGVDPNRGVSTAALTNAVRSVVMDKANGVTLVYDWASSATARQWELNFHSPNAFVADAANVRAVNGAASVCLDRYGPATSFAQTMAWDVAPETAQPAQAHGRFTALARSTEFAHLTVLRDGCRNVPVQVQRVGTQVVVSVSGGKAIQFDKRLVTLPQ